MTITEMIVATRPVDGDLICLTNRTGFSRDINHDRQQQFIDGLPAVKMAMKCSLPRDRTAVSSVATER